MMRVRVCERALKAVTTLIRAALNSQEIVRPIQNFDSTSMRNGVSVVVKDRGGGVLALTGYIVPVTNTWEAALDAAAAAAYILNTRHSNIPKENLVVEIVIFTMPEEIHLNSPMEYREVIDPKEEGAFIEKGFSKGAALPNSVTGKNVDGIEILSESCLNAGLPADAWLAGLQVYKFRILERAKASLLNICI